MQGTLGLARKPRIIVVGDVMLDVAVHGSCSKLANEAPIPVFKKERTRKALGGSGNVAANLAAMGCESLHLVGRVGVDAGATEVVKLCEAVNIKSWFARGSEPTITKTRYYAGKTLLFRHDEEVIAGLKNDEENWIICSVKALLESEPIDCVVLSDYAKGVLTDRICREIITACRAANICTVVDPKGRADKYYGCTVMKPNRVELKGLFMVGTEDMASAHKRVADICGCTASCITLSEDGISLGTLDGIIHRRNRRAEVVDVTGAGDVVCATLAYMWPLVEDKGRILEVANHYAMTSVGHLGSYVLQPNDFINCEKVKSIDAVATATVGKRVVFTNGCFDILHAGHLGLLKECALMGDMVVVGLNSDASVARLKGPTRPIHTVAERAAALAALDWISYIVVFEENTPRELLEVLRPAVLVKGGDYKAEDVVGREFAGEVVIVPFVAGHSTTRTVGLIKSREQDAK